MNYAAEQDLMRVIACASKQRDWDAIDRIMEEQRLRGNMSVMRDAQGGDELPPLAKPALVTIHDLPSLDGIEIIGKREGDYRIWRRKRAA